MVQVILCQLHAKKGIEKADGRSSCWVAFLSHHLVEIISVSTSIDFSLIQVQAALPRQVHGG
jgi:hypothetical protein